MGPAHTHTQTYTQLQRGERIERGKRARNRDGDLLQLICTDDMANYNS